MAKRKTAVADEPKPESPAEAPTATVESPPSDTNGNPPPSDTNVTATTEPPKNGDRRRPDQSFKVFSDKSTILEVAIWENEVRYDDRVSVQHSIAISRSFKNAEGKWVSSTAYRAHDLPLVRALLDQAHAWCAERRTETSNGCPF